MSDERLVEVLRDVVAQQRKLERTLKANARKGKDAWDKFSSLSMFLSTVLLAGIGALFTHVYNLKQDDRNATLRAQEIRVAQIQTVEKFVPYLTGTEDQKRIAILAIDALGNAEVATKLAALYPSEGTVSALKVIASTGEEPARVLANAALRSIFDLQRAAVVEIALGADVSRPDIMASGAVVSTDGYVITADYVVRAMPIDELRVVTADGKFHRATVMGTDRESGVSVLKLESGTYPALRFSVVAPRSGDTVLAIGTSGELALEPATGIVQRVDESSVYIEFDRDVGGFGGGPVFDGEGQIIAMVYETAEKPSERGRIIDRCIRGEHIEESLSRLRQRPGGT